jgi:hypothetical protein
MMMKACLIHKKKGLSMVKMMGCGKKEEGSAMRQRKEIKTELGSSLSLSLSLSLSISRSLSRSLDLCLSLSVFQNNRFVRVDVIHSLVSSIRTQRESLSFAPHLISFAVYLLSASPLLFTFSSHPLHCPSFSFPHLHFLPSYISYQLCPQSNLPVPLVQWYSTFPYLMSCKHKQSMRVRGAEQAPLHPLLV